MTREFQLGLAGCGNIAGGFDESSGFQHAFTHAGAASKHARFALRAIAEPSPERRSQFQATWSVPQAYPDVSGMLEHEPLDVLSVCTPDPLHATVIESALAKGRVKAILTEKPLADSLERATNLVARCRERDISLYVNYNRLWDPLHMDVKRQLAQGRLGVLQSGVGYYVRGLLHNGTTMISTLRHLLGGPVMEVQALSPQPDDPDPDPRVDGILTFESGLRVMLAAADKGGYGHSTFEIDLMGNRGRVQLIDNGFQVRWSDTAEYKRYPGVRELVPAEAASQVESAMDCTLLSTLDEVAHDLDRGIVTQEGAVRALGDLAVAEALLRSYRNRGERVNIVYPFN